MSRPAGLWEMVKLPMDLQRMKESCDGCQCSSSSQADMFKAFLHAMAGESHDRAARVGIFGGAVQVVMECSAAGIRAVCGEEMASPWHSPRRRRGSEGTGGERALRASVTTKWYFGSGE